MSICNFYFINFPSTILEIKTRIAWKIHPWCFKRAGPQHCACSHGYTVTTTLLPQKTFIFPQRSCPQRALTSCFLFHLESFLCLYLQHPSPVYELTSNISTYLTQAFLSLVYFPNTSLQGGFTWPHSSPFPSFMWMSYSTVCRPFFCQLTCGWPELFSCSEWRNIYLSSTMLSPIQSLNHMAIPCACVPIIPLLISTRYFPLFYYFNNSVLCGCGTLILSLCHLLSAFHFSFSLLLTFPPAFPHFIHLFKVNTEINLWYRECICYIGIKDVRQV